MNSVDAVEKGSMMQDALDDFKRAFSYNASSESDEFKSIVDEAILFRFSVCAHKLVDALTNKADAVNDGDVSDLDEGELDDMLNSLVGKKILLAHEKESIEQIMEFISMIKSYLTVVEGHQLAKGVMETYPFMCAVSKRL